MMHLGKNQETFILILFYIIHKAMTHIKFKSVKSNEISTWGVLRYWMIYTN